MCAWLMTQNWVFSHYLEFPPIHLMFAGSLCRDTCAPSSAIAYAETGEVWSAAAALPLWRGSLPFYFAVLHKKFRLGKPEGLELLRDQIPALRWSHNEKPLLLQLNMLFIINI